MRERVGSILEFAELQDYALVPVKGLSSVWSRDWVCDRYRYSTRYLNLDEVLSEVTKALKINVSKGLKTFG
jgi:ABC-type polysaccharide/polyol phosphate transport system ATPase subunit